MVDENTLRYDAAIHLMKARKLVDQVRALQVLLEDERLWERLRDQIEELEMEVQPVEVTREACQRHLDQLSGKTGLAEYRKRPTS